MEHITNILLIAISCLVGEWLYYWIFGYKRVWIKTYSLHERIKKRHRGKEE